MIECRIPNARDAVANRDACKLAAILERGTTNASDTVWNRDACKTVAKIERRTSNACDSAIRRDDAVLTTRNQRLALRFNDAFPRAVIDGIADCNCDAC